VAADGGVRAIGTIFIPFITADWPNESGEDTMQKAGTAGAYYKATPIFDQETLPEKLRKAHHTKAGTWGVIRVLEGKLRYVIEDTQLESILSPDCPGLVLPGQFHHVEPLGAMRMRVEFYDHPPFPEEQNR
jgi:tellurite resistance-related uncharacterized protein